MLDTVGHPRLPFEPASGQGRPIAWVVAGALALVLVLCSVGTSVRAQGGDAGWAASPVNPVVGLYRAPLALDNRAPGIWNDPAVLVEDDGYSMWASMGHDGPRGVAVYKLRSADGETWEVANGGQPVLSQGRSTDFDSLGVETPSVIKVGETYHMYYSAYLHGKVPVTTMGHAVSADGVHWTKLGELKSLTGGIGKKDGNKWGWLARAEPAALYHNGRFYLYFTDVRCRQSNCKGTPAAVRGISLAVSSDGHTFTQLGQAPVLLQTSSYPAAEGWEGYSTPTVVATDGRFDMFCGVFRQVDGQSIQVALTHLSSSDGVSFTEGEVRMMSAGTEAWADVSVRSPTVVVEGGVWRMWYAGDNYDPSRRKASRGAVNAGIGLTTWR